MGKVVFVIIKLVSATNFRGTGSSPLYPVWQKLLEHNDNNTHTAWGPLTSTLKAINGKTHPAVKVSDGILKNAAFEKFSLNEQKWLKMGIKNIRGPHKKQN
jgi:hypothetical protein